MHSHLVAIKVSVECRTCERVELDSLTFNQARLECLYTQAVKRRSTVEQYGVTLNNVFQNIHHNRVFTVDDFLSGFHRLHNTALNELTDDKRLIQFSSHVLGQTALVHLQLRTNHDNRTSGVVHTFTEEVLTEAALLTLERVRERLERTVSLRLNSRGLLRVIEE